MRLSWFFEELQILVLVMKLNSIEFGHHEFKIGVDELLSSIFYCFEKMNQFQLRTMEELNGI